MIADRVMIHALITAGGVILLNLAGAYFSSDGKWLQLTPTPEGRYPVDALAVPWLIGALHQKSEFSTLFGAGSDSAPKALSVLERNFSSSLKNETSFGMASKHPSYSLLSSNHHIHILVRRAKSSREYAWGHIERRILAGAVFQRHQYR